MMYPSASRSLARHNRKGLEGEMMLSGQSYLGSRRNVALERGVRPLHMEKLRPGYIEMGGVGAHRPHIPHILILVHRSPVACLKTGPLFEFGRR